MASKPFESFEGGPLITITDIELVDRSLGGGLPEDYKRFMLRANGGEGFLRGGGFLQLWRIEELEPLNRQYQVAQFAPGLTLFATDGAGTGYAFDSRATETVIVEVPLVGMSLSEVVTIADCFGKFLEYLEQC